MSSRREINGNTPHNGKRKTNRDRRHTGPVNFKYNNSPSSYTNHFDPNLAYYPNNQNMFPAISDPSLCYPIMNYPYEPLSLPNYNPYQPFYRNHNHCPPPPNYFKPHSEQHTNYFKPQTQDVDEFTSLPVVNGVNDDDKRRFSDPGIPNECDDTDDSTKNEQVVQCLIEQVNYLKDSNRRLFRELQEMRGEMNFLKQQFGVRFYEKEYEPGMLSDVVREIRDAARIREETLLSKVKHEVKNIIEEKQMTVVSA